MENKKEMTIPNVSAATDAEQSLSKCTDNSIVNQDTDFKGYEQSFEEMQREILRQLDPSYLKTVSMTTLYDTVFEVQTPLIDGLLQRGTYLFVGSPKVGKSFMMAQLAYHISTGTPLWEYKVRKATVLYFALEDDYPRLQKRLFQMFGAKETGNLYFATECKTVNGGLEEQIRGFMREHPDTGLIIIDTLKRVREAGGADYSYAKLPYRRYVEERLHKFEIQKQRALSDRREKKIRDEKYQRVMQSVQGALRSCTRQAPSVAKNLKDKMHTVKAMERRFEKEDENMTQMPEQEEAIFVKLGDENSHIPAGKTVIEYELSKLVTPDGKRILAEGIHLKIKGSEKICMIGANGAGKTTLLKKIAEELLNRNDIKAEYMPQTYEDLLDLDVTPVDYLDKTGDKEERTRIRTYLGSLKYTPDEMEHPIRELSGGQKAKVLLLRMSLSGANVLILDEPTRNFSPLSGPVIRKMLREFPGAVISISHDRKYIEEVCDKIYQLNPNGLQLIGD